MQLIIVAEGKVKADILRPDPDNIPQLRIWSHNKITTHSHYNCFNL